jgi:protein-L-isoaspartate(D-aspartate) O-methyltransferase
VRADYANLTGIKTWPTARAAATARRPIRDAKAAEALALKAFELYQRQAQSACYPPLRLVNTILTSQKGPMDRYGELSIIRAAYAKQILAAAGVVDNVRLEAALSATRREDFLGAGPWWMLRRFQDYVTTPDADPVYLYTDDLVGILPERRINNGQPSLHAHLIHQASPGAGEHVVHIGTGTGYYTAILAHIVGPSGRVTGIEYEPELAARARTSFATYPNVDIIEGDGALVSFDTADVIYVNAGCTQPAESWLLDRLADGGRLILPMTSYQTRVSGQGTRVLRQSRWHGSRGRARCFVSSAAARII